VSLRPGLRVDAVDASQAMVDVTAGRMAEAHSPSGSRSAPPTFIAAVRAEHFDLVVAVGVLPWLHSPGTPSARWRGYFVRGARSS